VDELIGKRMGPYTVTERIGDGGMAIVYKAYQESLNRYVALKVLRDELARDQQFVARFRQEALGAANLDHPNIVHVYDAGAANGKYFIAMSYVDGGDLKGLIHQGAIEPDRAVAITIQLAEALDHAHKQGLIHRDVKPSNVLMTRDGRPLLTDFGIAKALYESRQLTRTGTSIGTPEYMAPEQAQGLPPDGRTDIYALGVVLYEMLAAKVPFCTDTPVATMYMHVHEPPPSLRQVQGAVPQWLENVVCKALAKNPDDRYATAGLFAAALRQGQDSMRAAAWGATAAPDARTAIGPAVAAGAAAAGAQRPPTPSSELPTAIGPSAAAGAAAARAQRPPTPSSDLPTAIGPAGAPTPAEALAAVGAAGAAAGAVGRTATPAPVGKKRPKALIPILIAAIALLIIAVSASAALLLGGGDDTPTIVTVIVSPDTPTAEAPGGAVDETPDTPTATGEISPTPTNTLTASPTTSATASPTASPTTSATASPSTSPTPSLAPTRTATVAPTATNTAAPTDTQPPPPTNTPEPPTKPPPTDTSEPPTKPPPTDTPVPPPPTQEPTKEPPPP